MEFLPPGGLFGRQKEGKKRLREIAKVQVPPEAFVAMVKM